MDLLFKFLLLVQVLVSLGHPEKFEEEAANKNKCVYMGTTANCSSRNLSEVPQDLHRNIQTLLLNGNNLTRIGPEAFKVYPNLLHLNLINNRLSLLPGVYDPMAFAGLDSLKQLNIEGNCDSFKYPSSKYSYPGNALSNLTSLEKLSIDGVPDVILDSGFRELRNLSHLRFSGNCYLNHLRKEMFSHTIYLQFLDISKCYIYDIDKDTFSPLISIHTIDASQNYGLGLNNVSKWTEGLVGTSIRVLKLDRIVLPFTVGVTIRNDSFVHLRLTNISEVHLNHNAIELLEDGTLDHYPPSLEVIHINDNRLTMGQYVYDSVKMTGLRRLYISDMAISHHFVHSERLLSRMGKSQKSYIWQGPPNLETIVARNFLMGGSIPALNINLSSIFEIDISENVLQNWTGPVQYVESLQKAKMSRCFCSYITPGFFMQFKALSTLDISYNLIGDQLNKDNDGTLFRPLTLLKNLDLSANRITSLHTDIFLENVKLKRLDLSKNELAKISFKMEQLKELSYLLLEGNQIRSLPPEIRQALNADFKNLSVNFKDNPLQCTCENIGFITWLFNTKVTFLEIKSYTCINENNERIPLNKDLLVSLQTKCKNFFGILFGGTAAVALVLSISIIGLVYRYRWKIKYMYYVARDRYRPLNEQGGEQRYFDFDAFVSFADEDLEFVNKLVDELEGRGRRLCVHHRDFRPGEPIAANVVKAVQRSRRTILILSRHFLSSHWCRYEFEMAKMESVHEARSVLLVVKIQDLDAAKIPRELMYMMRTDSYSEFPVSLEDQPAFWITLNAAIGDLN